jgi:hypothetical protein
MQVTHHNKNWFSEHAEGIFVWGMGLLLVAMTMYLIIMH